MQRSNRYRSLAILIATTGAVAFSALPVRAQPPPRIIPNEPPIPWVAPTAQTNNLRPLDFLEPLTQPQLDMAAVHAEDEQRARDGLAPRYAIPQPVLITPQDHGDWEPVNDREVAWRLRVRAPGAVSLNFGLTRYKMPPGGRLFVYSASFQTIIRPFTERDNADHGELWTPPVDGDDAILEVTLPAELLGALDLEIGSINVGYRRFADLFRREEFLPRSGACNVDVVCPEADPWRMEIPSVGVISTGGSTFCTGFMVNDTSGDLRPFFMTANHCGINTGNAPSLVVFWNYQNSWCRPVNSQASGQPGDGSMSQFQTGSTFRSAYSASDFTLVELSNQPDPTWNVSYAGWNRALGEASSGVCIHHPNTDEKRITFYNTPTVTVTSWSDHTPNPNGNHVHVFWSLGVTEPGSSGSPLFDQNHRVIGQLHGGPSACGGSDLSDYYGRVSTSWTGGGSDASRLSTWLDAVNTGAMTTNTISSGGLVVTPSGVVRSIGPVGGPFTNDTTVYTIRNSTSRAADYEVVLVSGGTAPILINGGVGPITGAIAAGRSETVTVSFDAAAYNLGAGIYSTDVRFSDLTNNLVTNRTHELEIGQTAFDTQPTYGLSSGGPIGGPFNATQDYTMTSTRPTPVTIRVSADHPWISLNGAAQPVEFTLPTDGSSATVTVGFSSAANSLPPGIYHGSVTFTNLSGSLGNTTRPVTLDVGRYSYTATDVPQPINDYSTITSTIHVSDNFCIGDVDVPIDITHTYIGDLLIELTSPQGTVVRLHNRTGGGTDNLVRTYDDATAPPDGPGRLSDFNGQSSQGAWTLTVSDQAGADTGTLNAWGLRLASAGANCPTREVIHSFPLDTNPGWRVDADWAFGRPTGNAGDPSSGFTGTNVYGYNLNGAYPNNLTPARYLTTTPLDLSGITSTRLQFRRWLGVESSSWDHARVQASTDGTNWTTIWENPTSNINETAWSLQSYDISAIADNQPRVYIRWSMGTTDSSLVFQGWNIDDIEISGIRPDPCVGVLRGDVSFDGQIDGMDVQPFERVLMDSGGATPAERCAADCNVDGRVDANDVPVLVSLLLNG